MARLSDDDIARRLEGLDWAHEGEVLRKSVKGRNFATALAWVNAVGEVAEEANHHPDIDIRWNVVTLRLTTHDEGGITEKDFALARTIDELGAPA